MPIWLLIKPFLSLRNIGYFALALLVAYGSYKVYAWHSAKVEAKHLADIAAGKSSIQKLWDAQKAIDKKAYDKSVVEAKAKDDAWNKQIQDAQNEATKQKQIASVAASVAHNSAISLLSSTNIAETKLPNATKETSDQYTKVLTAAFEDCVGQYGQMGQIADQYKIAYEQLDSSWPSENPDPISTSAVAETK